MRLFACPSCSQVVYFENVVCERCNHALGYEPHSNAMLALEQADDGSWTSVGQRSDSSGWFYCTNYDQSVCNWLVPASGGRQFCDCCRHNLVVPSTDDAANLDLWRRMEVAKRRLFYTIFRLGLPRDTRADHPEGLGFQFLSDDPNAAGHVMTGHDDGLITIALVEADDAEREKRRSAMGEPYRTLLGHFRHEVGHWYWDRLVRDGGLLEQCRAVFGDDSVDYEQSLQTHYANGPRPGWQDEYLSSYAAVHPWEDFAETWAHYFHITDTLDTARALGFKVDPRVDKEDAISTEASFDVYGKGATIGDIATSWFATAAALNMLNRSIGIGDAYPFVLADAVVRKLGFIHDLVHGRIQNRAAA
ncbi:putative zinc-binding peptidase [Methylopila sp. M107]|uniref:zinc-binding metallopeptidase family protein n=1 Tax=Methylopila sp. M107 TaxID=1101190 RepID=UPI00037E753F|nr:putative zinc-binding peptidase [Methylopila sp. M107]